MPFNAAKFINTVANGRLERVVKPWGWEVIVDTGDMLLKTIYIKKGARTSLQYHQRKEEVIVKCGGSGYVEVTGKEFHGCEPLHILPGTLHRSVGDMLLLEVTTRDNSDVVRVDDDYGRKDV
jgi:mannose-6-phosphate isomerase